MTKLPRSYCDYRTPEEALANTQKAWAQEDIFFTNVIEPLGGQKIGTDSTRQVGKFSTTPDFLINNLYIEYQTSRVVTKHLQIKQHKYNNFSKYPKLVLIHKMPNYYYLIDSIEEFSIVIGGLKWCGGKPGYELLSHQVDKLRKLTEAELYEELKKKLQEAQDV